ncbi:ATP-dependent zinc metalloprotease FtsH 4 [Gemmata obscuriglobus]|uniref:ATP-binding protein n=1 Tax=Gemmata obscuriglobus TaxID=114 RepID=A0A2Z3H3B8_9BACT|nr:ATP-binding protein [Gemmata obscuriglobus]AWM40258.1 ATP-binding protein [Gemmata obscuriglobus]QEG26543.1 ATP-dependent zinc metalloprotease FtsH 4 [Gemmata obscuriglobus]VTS01916.1 atpase aaa : AAA ATPase OS=Xanthomonas axonopodis pv. malvacearum str. GSPB2388 GN=WS7_04973 PE=4 SV=1: AAA [Gemmata obscuriglobus UQM 2246]
MNADILKRLVRAIAEGAQDDLNSLAQKVIETERESGHSKLAGELDRILQRTRQRGPTTPAPDLRELPSSRRNRELLVSLHQRDTLEHSMVLPADVEERFARVEREYAARERLSAYGLQPRKRVLLYGPPGCGKSLGAKRLAWNTTLPLMKVRFDALLSSYFGESAANLRMVFEAAKERPCVLLLDECDFIARSRTGSRDIGEASRVVNALLQFLDEYDAPGILVATTNVEESLDEAIFRRFDDVFLIPLPGHTEIERLLRLTLSAIKVGKVDWNAVTGALAGASAAYVVKAARDAAKAAVLAGRKVVEEGDLQRAIGEIRKGNSSTP